MGTLFKKTLTGNVEATGTLSGVIVRGHTGRSIPAGADYELAQEWAALASVDELLSHTAANRFRADLACISAVAGTDLICVRGRPDDPSIASWHNMGPPVGSEQRGRYNASGTVALYTCDSVDGVLRELAPKPGTRIFLQDYRFSPNALRLADVSSVRLTEFVKAVFDQAENSSVEGRVGASGYAFSQVVGQLVREAGFEGMVVPGVRGDLTFQYCNIVVFDLHGRWVSWSCQGDGFRYVVAGDGAV